MEEELLTDEQLDKIFPTLNQYVTSQDGNTISVKAINEFLTEQHGLTSREAKYCFVKWTRYRDAKQHLKAATGLFD